MFLSSHLQILSAFLAGATLVGAPLVAEEVPLELQITEFFIDPPGGGDRDEYVEIFGRRQTEFAEATVEGQFTYYLLMLENEGGDAGQVDKIVPLKKSKINDEGYAWYYGAGGEDYAAEGGHPYEGTSENSGCTLLLVAVPFGERHPLTSDDYNGTTGGVAKLGGDWDPNWIVLDAVGVMCEKKDVACGGALYAPVNFAAGNFARIATPANSLNVNTDVYKRDERGAFDKIGYAGRNRDRRWFAANLTDSGEGWSAERRNYRVAADDENGGEPECVDFEGNVPYQPFKDITVSFGMAAPCNCGDESKPKTQAQTPSTSDTGPKPTPVDATSTKLMSAKSSQSGSSESEIRSILVPK